MDLEQREQKALGSSCCKNKIQNGNLLPYKRLNITAALSYHSCKCYSPIISCCLDISTNTSQENFYSCPFIPVLICMNCNASFAAPQTPCPERDPASLKRWPNLLVVTVKRNAPSSRRKVTEFKQGCSSGKLSEGIFPHRVIVTGS